MREPWQELEVVGNEYIWQLFQSKAEALEAGARSRQLVTARLEP